MKWAQRGMLVVGIILIAFSFIGASVLHMSAMVLYPMMIIGGVLTTIPLAATLYSVVRIKQVNHLDSMAPVSHPSNQLESSQEKPAATNNNSTNNRRPKTNEQYLNQDNQQQDAFNSPISSQYSAFSNGNRSSFSSENSAISNNNDRYSGGAERTILLDTFLNNIIAKHRF